MNEDVFDRRPAVHNNNEQPDITNNTPGIQQIERNTHTLSMQKLAITDVAAFLI